jgi:hypothetical protein
MQSIPLNLPEYTHKIKKVNGELYIFDAIRKKYLVLTPEEWVRQNIITYLVEVYAYPKALMSVESGLKYHQRLKRSDILVYDLEGKPFFLIECKSMQVGLNQAVLDQMAQYNHIVKAPFMAMSNGLEMWIYHIQESGIRILEEIPRFPLGNG